MGFSREGIAMWKRAADVPKADADKILERWDQTAPEVQRMMMLQKFLDQEDCTAKETRLINVARGCFDYSGGYVGDKDRLRAFHHGIQTVVNALEAAVRHDPDDMQINVLERMGLEYSSPQRRVAQKAVSLAPNT
jgi:hypothetical protein